MINPDKIFGRLGNRMFQMAYIYAQMRDGAILDIWLQDEKYFKKYEEDIKKMFGEEMGFTDFVAVHVRRGKNPINPDEPAYFENPYYVDLCSTDYYEKAIALFPNEKFLVFSDDIEWCKKSPIFKGDNFQFVEGNTDIEDMNMIGSCKGVIMANSSFSYWAAWLNPNPAKKIVAPIKWYSDGDVTRTVCPSTWIRI